MAVESCAGWRAISRRRRSCRTRGDCEKDRRLLAVELLLASRKVDAAILHVETNNRQIDRNAADGVYNLGELQVYSA